MDELRTGVGSEGQQAGSNLGPREQEQGGKIQLVPFGMRVWLPKVGGLAWWRLWLRVQGGLLQKIRLGSLEEVLLHCSSMADPDEKRQLNSWF